MQNIECFTGVLDLNFYVLQKGTGIVILYFELSDKARIKQK